MSQGFAAIPGIGTCGGRAPILWLEFADNAREAAALLAAPACPGAQRTGLWLDTAAFIPAYLFFILFIGRALMPLAPRRCRAARLAIIIGGALDVVENVQLFRLLDGKTAFFSLLSFAVHAKFAVIALSVALLGVVLIQRGALAGRIAGIAAAAAGALSAVMLAINPYDPKMFGGTALGLTALWVASLIAAVRPALVVAPPAAPAA